MRFLSKIFPEKIFNLDFFLSNYRSLSFVQKLRDILDKRVKAYFENENEELNKNGRAWNERACGSRRGQVKNIRTSVFW